MFISDQCIAGIIGPCHSHGHGEAAGCEDSHTSHGSHKPMAMKLLLAQFGPDIITTSEDASDTIIDYKDTAGNTVVIDAENLVNQHHLAGHIS